MNVGDAVIIQHENEVEDADQPYLGRYENKGRPHCDPAVDASPVDDLWELHLIRLRTSPSFSNVVVAVAFSATVTGSAELALSCRKNTLI